MSRPMNLSERLERAARKADEIAEELGRRSTHARQMNDEGVASMARLSLIMQSAAAILRAGRDPVEPLREDMIRERSY
jgi:hypothetical protein